MLNTAAGFLGEAMYDGLQRHLRRFYHQPLFEVAILGSAVIHVAATVTRKVQEARTSSLSSAVADAKTAPPRPKQFWSLRRLHHLSGYIVLCFIGGHVWGCRLHNVAPEFAGLAWIQSLPVVGPAFSVYLVLFAAAGWTHLSLGLPRALRIVGFRRAAQRLAVGWTTIVVGCSVLALGVFGIRGGVVATGGKFGGSPYALANQAMVWR